MSGGLHSLATIIKRLEAATSRLEDLAVAQAASGPKQDDLRDEPNPNAPAAPVPPPNGQARGAAPAPPPAALPQSVVAYDEIVVDGKLKPFVELTRSFAAQVVVEQVELVEKMFLDLRGLLLQAAACQKPDQAVFGELLEPLQADIQAISRAKEANRKQRDWFNHMSAIAEGAPVVGWVTISPKPVPYVKEIADSAQFYTNRVIKEFKEKDPKHSEWAKSFTALLEGLRKYVADNHTTGLVWNPTGVAVKDYKAPSSSASASGAPPPPPPPPPAPAAPPAPPAGAAPAAGGGNIGAVFADLNRGEAVTAGLRKVDKSEMTHKNPALRAAGVVPASPPSAVRPAMPAKKPSKPLKPSALQGKKPAKFALEGNKWAIEYHENESGLVVDNTEISHIVNLFGCKNTTVIVKGKVNAVTLVNCHKTSVLVESVISAISVTASPSFTLQITGTAPTIQLDTTDSGQIYLSRACVDVVEIVTAKCSAINVSLPVPGEEDGVFEEKAVPEMLRTVVREGKLVTAVVEHTG